MRRSLVLAASVAIASFLPTLPGASGGVPVDGPIAFSSFPAASDTNVAPLRTIDPDTLMKTTLVDTKLNFDADYTADGSQLVFARGGPDGTSIYTANPDGSARLRITDGGPNAFDSSPSWSPDASRIVFQRCMNRCRLWMMDDDGSNLGRVTDATTVSELNPDWGSNDRIVYVRSATNTHGIATIDPGGTGRVQLTTKLDDNPAWAPDASTIAFDRFKRSGPANPIMLMTADGSGVQQVTGGKRYDAMPAFAPIDGDELVFGRGTAPLGADPVMDLWTVNLDGSNLDRLTDTPKRSELFPTWGAA